MPSANGPRHWCNYADPGSEQAALGWVFYKMAKDPETMDRERALQELASTEDAMRHLVAEVSGKPQEAAAHGDQRDSMTRRITLWPNYPMAQSSQLMGRQ